MEQPRPSIVFHLDPQGPAPYRQLMDQVAQALRLGQLQTGDQLPSVRSVVTQITINPNTVHRAYREMEHLGYVETRTGLGTFVATATVAHPSDELSDHVRRALVHGRSRNELIDLVNRISDEMELS